MPNLIALDTGLQRLGYCHISYDFQKNYFSIKKFGTFETSSKQCRALRLRNIKKFLETDLLWVVDNEECFEDVDMLIYEYPSFTNQQSLILGAVMGIIELTYYELELKQALSISPTEVKKKIFGKGIASKNQVKLGVIKKLQEYDVELDLSNCLDDTIDAIAIALVTYEDIELKWKFEKFSNMVREETGGSPFLTDREIHPAYQEITKLGEPVIPLLLQSMLDNKGLWFKALRDLTGKDAATNIESGKVSEMIDAWVNWGRKQGHLK